MPTKKAMKKTTKSATAKKGRKGGLSTMAIGAAGAVAGAVIGGAAAAALADEKKRKMAGEAVNTVADYAADAIDAANETTMDMQTTMSEPAPTAIEPETKTPKKS